MPETGGGRKGGCLCGAVRYRTGPVEPIMQCHCENCRRLTGNFVAGSRTPYSALDIDDPRQTFHWHDLEYARYGFCSGCGSTLFYQATARPDLIAVMVGTLDDATGLEVSSVWYADEAQPHNTLPPGVPHHAGNPAGDPQS